MPNKKYEFTGETKEYKGRTLRRIRRLSDGLVGGWIESESNLSPYGKCFVFDNAIVCDCAIVSENAKVFGDCLVYNYAIVNKNVTVLGNVAICEDAIVTENVQLNDRMRIAKDMFVNDSAKMAYIASSKHPITIIKTCCNKVYVSIGNHTLTIDKWKRHYKKIAKRNNVSVEDIERYKNIISMFNLN